LGFDLDGNIEDYLTLAEQDSFLNYDSLTLPDGTYAKIAIFFLRLAICRLYGLRSR
jgi:hypothetical protein